MKFPRGLVKTSRLKLILLALVCTGCYLTLKPYRNQCDLKKIQEIGLNLGNNSSDETRRDDTSNNEVLLYPRPQREKDLKTIIETDLNLENNLSGETRHDDTSDNDVLLFPTPQREKGFLTIGIPTIKRDKASYWSQTISSLLLNMSPTEKEEVLIVIFLADKDHDIKRNLAEEVNATFYDSVSSGLIQIIQAPKSYYSKIDISKNLYLQSKQYMLWRTKQCYDYAYLMEYSIGLSAYYMQLEDDVVALPGYIESIKQFMEEQNKKPFPWVCLEFSELGFIGKLYRSSDLKKLSNLLKLFAAELPVDYIYTYFNMLSSQMSQRLRMPTLFQHIGIRSSSPRNIQRLKDRFYGGVDPPVNEFLSAVSSVHLIQSGVLCIILLLHIYINAII